MRVALAPGGRTDLARRMADDRRLVEAIAVERIGTLLKSPHHAPDRFIEELADEHFQQARPELEIHMKVESASAAILGAEAPVILQILERSVLVLHVDREIWLVERNSAGKTLPYPFETNGEFGTHFGFRPAENPRRDTPGKELRIAVDVGHQIKKLLRPVRNRSLFGVSRHDISRRRSIGREFLCSRVAQAGKIIACVIGRPRQWRGRDRKSVV